MKLTIDELENLKIGDKVQFTDTVYPQRNGPVEVCRITPKCITVTGEACGGWTMLRRNGMTMGRYSGTPSNQFLSHLEAQ